MTVEIEYRQVREDTFRWNQLEMARQIESNRGFPLSDIERELRGDTLLVRVETTLPDSAVENMLAGIEDHLNPEANHEETREV